MKAIYKSLLAGAMVAPLLTGCIEEAIPTDTITQGELEGTPKGTEALVWAMPGHMNVIGTLDLNYHFDFGWPSLMHIHDVMTEDMYVRDAGGYNWFASWSSNVSQGPDYLICQYPWNYYYAQVITTNKTIAAVDPETTDAQLQQFLGSGYAYRAFVYLDLARTYEFLPTEFNAGKSPDGKDILGLTVPIVDENTTEDMMRNNPRVSHEAMFEFITSDLTKAIDLLSKGGSPSSKTLPGLQVAYGLMARAYLWDASYQEEIKEDAAKAATQYGEAAKYAQMAYAGLSPMTQQQWLDPATGFNTSDPSAWMFAGQYVPEDNAVVAGGIRTWSSFMTVEETFGYAAPAQGAMPEINAAMYKRISDRDFRKLAFTPEEGSSLADRISYVDAAFAAEHLTDPYLTLKFRPGGGNMSDPAVGAVVAYPLMRVEEMYFIEAEAVAHTNAAQGKALLEKFMKTYRYATYASAATSTEDVVEEIIFQKRVELWGEGQSFFDIKRLNYSTTRWYDGTNFQPGLDTFNTNGRAAWMNFCIVRQEINNNKALEGFNNPDPSDLYDANK